MPIDAHHAAHGVVVRLPPVGPHPHETVRGPRDEHALFDAPAANAEFAAKESLPFRLLSDDGTLAVAVGAASGSDQRARRISYLVGGDGKVVRAYPEVQPAAHAGQVLLDVSQIAH